MARVKGPNGVVVDVPDHVASGLVGRGNRGYSYVEDAPKPRKAVKAKPDSFKSRPAK